MSWKNRKLFNNLPQGIVSGLEPIPRYQMGGMVQGYETGGSFPNKGLAALNKVAPDVVKTIMGKEDGGFVNPRNYVGGGTVEYPIGMEAGSLVPEVFESGDQQINEALNTMLATTMPTGDATTSVAMEEPTGDVADILPEATTGDSSSKESLFVSEVNQQKKILQDTIEKVIAEKTQEDIDPITLKTQITDFVTKADSLFKRKVTDIANKLNVEVMPEQVTLLTDDFSTKLETMFPSVAALEPEEDDMQVAMMDQGLEIPGMEHGGLHIANNVPESVTKSAPFLDIENKKTRLEKFYGSYKKMPENMKKSYDALVQQQIALSGKVVSTKEAKTKANEQKERERLTAIITSRFASKKSKEDAQAKLNALNKVEKEEKEEKTPPPSLDTSLNSNLTSPNLSDLLKQNADAVKNAALMTGKTKQGGISGFMDVVGQANLLSAKAERENLLNQLKVEAETTALGDKYEEAAFASAVDQLDETGAVEFYILNGRPLPKSRQNIIPAGKVDGADFAQYLKIYRSTDKNTPFETIVADFRAKAA